MRRNFWKATLISLAAYSVAVLIGFGAGFQYTAFLVVALQASWTLFCVIRAIQLRRSGGHKASAPEYEREDYGFALGGTISSITLLVVIVVLTQAV
jgi:hypothetical protein